MKFNKGVNLILDVTEQLLVPATVCIVITDLMLLLRIIKTYSPLHLAYYLVKLHLT